jgi:hypothetical protein
MGILAGVLSGFAYLTKASMLPTVAVYVVWSVALAANELLAGRREAGLARLVSTSAVLLLALAVIFPYLSDNKRIYGRWFYNVNTRFNFWCDSWSEVEQGTKAHGAQWRWPDMPPEEIPSLGRYVRSHTAGQIAERIANGSRVVLTRMSRSYGYFKYAALEVLLAAFLLSRNRAWAVDLVKRRWAAAGFLATYFSVSFLLVAWYVPISTGNRFILGHFLPLLFTASMVATHAPETRVAGRSIVRLASRSILVLLILDLVFQLLPHTLSINGGH